MTSRRGSGEGAVYRRADGLWVAAVDLPRGPDGPASPSGRQGEDQARGARPPRPERREATEGLVPDRSTTVGAYLTWWFGNACGHLKPTTMSSYRWLSTQYIVPRLGPVRLAQLTPAHVRTMLGGLEASGYSANTRRLARAVLRRALDVAERDGLVARNVRGVGGWAFGGRHPPRRRIGRG